MKRRDIISNLTIMLSIVFLLSCSENPIFHEVENDEITNLKIPMTTAEVLSIAYGDTNNDLSENEVLNYVREFKVASQTRSLSTITNIEITDKYYTGNNTKTRASETLSIPFYKVKFQKNGTEGCAVVSGDKRSPGVIAYIEKTDTKSHSDIGKKYMLDVAQTSTIHEIEKVIQYQDSLRVKTINKLSQELGIPKEQVSFEKIKNNICITDQTITRSEPYEPLPTPIVSWKSPFVKVKWGQEVPYNMLLPRASQMEIWYFPNNTIKRYIDIYRPVGCGVVSIAEALTYLKPDLTINGTTMNWELLTKDELINYSPEDPNASTYPQANMAATLIKHIYERTNTMPILAEVDTTIQPGPNYPIVIASSTKNSDLITFMQTISNFTTYNNWEPDAILNGVMNNHISIVGGYQDGNPSTGHTWIIDGYAMCIKTNREILKQYDLYFHANMGWNGNNDGYYKFNPDTTIDFETSNGTFNSNFLVLANITKK